MNVVMLYVVTTTPREYTLVHDGKTYIGQDDGSWKLIGEDDDG